MKAIHQRLMAWAVRMSAEGDTECAWWVNKMIALEQKKQRKPRGIPKKKVRLKGGQTAWVPKKLIDEAQ